VRSKNKTKVKPGPLLNEAGIKVEKPLELAEEFNTYFSSVFTEELVESIPKAEPIFDKSEDEQLLDIEITEEMVRERLSRLRADKAPGDDGISSRFLRELQEELVAPLLLLFRKSLNEGNIPEDWRTANVTPIFKKGSRAQVGNYRPVSLTSQISKMMETLIRDAIVQHLERNNLIKNSQHGFRGGRSCLSNLLIFLDRVTHSMDNGEGVDVIFLDFAKAFDKVPHERLKEKIKSHGIGGKIWRWISEWLSDRKQRVCLQGNASGWRRVTSGVPQGSVLGPILFLIFINDLDCDIFNWLLKFADDTKLFSSVQDSAARDRLQKDLDTLVRWADDWQMKFNVEKCKVMHIGRSNPQFSYNMNGTNLETITTEKDLGVTLVNTMNSSIQCGQAYNRASRMLGMVSRTISCRSPGVLVNIYKSIVRPHLEYCSPAWSPHYIKDKDILERVQHRFTRMFADLRTLEYKKRLEILGLWTLEERRNRADLIEVFKMEKGFSATPLETFFEVDRTGRMRGHNIRLIKHYSKCNPRHFFFSERVVKRWNSLSQEAVDAKSVDAFKGHLTRARNMKMGFFMDDVR
jgi:hypothetical protein